MSKKHRHKRNPVRSMVAPLSFVESVSVADTSANATIDRTLRVLAQLGYALVGLVVLLFLSVWVLMVVFG